jgi:hypothetical protein
VIGTSCAECRTHGLREHTNASLPELLHSSAHSSNEFVTVSIGSSSACNRNIGGVSDQPPPSAGNFPRCRYDSHLYPVSSDQ